MKKKGTRVPPAFPPFRPDKHSSQQGRGGACTVLFPFPRLCPELFAILSYDGRRRLQPDPHASALVDIDTFSGNPPNDVLSRQNRCHNGPTTRANHGFFEPIMPFFQSIIEFRDIYSF
jgi:hypothetical protein